MGPPLTKFLPTPLLCAIIYSKKNKEKKNEGKYNTDTQWMASYNNIDIW
jgi:hypothetical protein